MVIGSGFGGLAAAIRLQAKGYRTTILEMRDKPGGRAYVYEDEGFVFDAGPTIITVPFLFEELAEVAGKRLDDYVTIVPCDPYYRIYFDDGSTFDYVGDRDRFEAEIARFNPDDVAGYRRFAAYTRRVFDRAFTDLAAPLVPQRLGDGQGRPGPDAAPGRGAGLPPGLAVHQGPEACGSPSRSSRC